jgi:flagellar basal-body rod modification protein FlgD
MDLTGITTETSSLTAAAPQGQKDLGKEAFMGLLVEQMKNQDPMNPQSNEDFVAQLANFSTLEQMEQMNSNLLGMALLEESNALLSQLTEGSALIGKTVNWTDPATGAPQQGEVQGVKIDNGMSHLKIDGVEVPLIFVNEVLGSQTGASVDGVDEVSGEDAAEEG